MKRREFWKRVLGLPMDMTVPLGQVHQPSSLFAAIDTLEVWKEHPVAVKGAALFRLGWKPSESVVAKYARRCFEEEIFGGEKDYGDALFKLMVDHHSRPWNFQSLTGEDERRIAALEAMTVLTQTRFRGVVSRPGLNLELGDRAPELCFLVFPMVIKIPVVSLRYFLYVHSRFAFAEVRRSNHSHADDIIAYLYEVLYLQQKVAISLHEFLRLVAYAHGQKGMAQLINAEVNAIMGADATFSYLKASIEKTVALVGLTYGIDDLDGKKTHAAKLSSLKRLIPVTAQSTWYASFLLDELASENLDELNRFRSGLLHKKGVADLQPHNYVGIEPPASPLKSVFSVMHEQHSKNTLLLISALALLTDELVRLQPVEV